MTKLIHTQPAIEVINTEADSVELRLYLHPEIDYFKGHFEGAPIVAGVVQLDWAVNLGKQYLALSGDVADIEVLKFQVVMTPGLYVNLLLTRKSDEKFTFSYQSDKGQHASGRVVLRP